MARRTNDLGNDPIGPLLLRLAVPTIVAQLVNALYNIVDRMFIGKIVGVVALTGVGVAFPIIMFVSALAGLVGAGGGSRAAVHMGAGDNDRAEAILGNSVTLLVVLSVACTVLFQIFKEPILYLFGASPDTIRYATTYLGVYLWGTVSVLLALGLNTFITAQGFSTFAMATTLIGAGCNIALDALFMVVFHMGVMGAALATIISQTFSAVWVVLFLVGKRTKLRIHARHLKVRMRIIGPVLALGVSPFIMQATESLVNISFNASLQKYGGDLYVGAMTIASSVMMVATMPFMGLTQGAQPIISYNYGAGKTQRVKKTFKLLLISGLTVSIAAFALIQLFPGFFVGIFNNKPELVDVTVWAMHIYFGGLFLLGIQFACQQTFVALGEAKVSLFLAALRKIILLIPLIFILPNFLANKVFAVYLAEPVADILASITTGIIFFWRFPKILKRREKELGLAEE